MTHWAERYLGEPYIEGENDCATLAARVQLEVFGRHIALPAERMSDYRGWSRQIQAHKDDYADPVEHPAEGDAVLMVGRGRLNHIGIYCELGEVPHVLHAMKSAGQVVLHRIRDLDRYGLAVEGYYRWR